MCLNHSEIIPPPHLVENQSSKKSVPSAKKVGDCYGPHSLFLLIGEKSPLVPQCLFPYLQSKDSNCSQFIGLL